MVSLFLKGREIVDIHIEKHGDECLLMEGTFADTGASIDEDHVYELEQEYSMYELWFDHFQ
jgi:hypothetical protein